MKALFLDTASRSNCFALCDKSHTLLLRPLDAHKDSALLTDIEAGLKEVGWQYADLTHLVAVSGPGGFTSLRIGVTLINTLAYALGIPAAGIHLSDLWQKRIHLPLPTSHLLVPSGIEVPLSHYWLHSTRRTHLFARGLGEASALYPEPTLLPIEEAAALEGAYVGELLPEHTEALTRCHPLPPKNIRPLEEVLPSLLGNLTFGKDLVLPWYGRGI